MDLSQYHPDWRDIIRPAILKRDNYKCQHCGVRHKIRCYKDTQGKYIECDTFMEEWAKSTNRRVFTLYLQVAHKDHNKSNNDPNNLITLCPVHHARYDSEHKRFARIMYKTQLKNNSKTTKNNVPSLRPILLNNIASSVRSLTSVKLSPSDCEVILQNVLTCFDSNNKK